MTKTALKKIGFCFSISLLMFSCKKDTNVTSYKDIAVVEGYLYNGHTVSVRITKQIQAGSTDGTIYTIDTLHLYIVHNNDTIPLRSTGSGNYIGDSSLIIQQGQTYGLIFKFNDITVHSSTTVPYPPSLFNESATSIAIPQISSGTSPSSFTQPDPVKLTWDNVDQSYYLIVVKDTDSNPETIFSTTDTSVTRPTFRIQPTQGNSYELRSMQFSYYGTHTITLFHINPEYAGLYDTEGNSSQDLRQPSTNIVNGVGIFTSISSDTLYLKVKKS